MFLTFMLHIIIAIIRPLKDLMCGTIKNLFIINK